MKKNKKKENKIKIIFFILIIVSVFIIINAKAKSNTEVMELPQTNSIKKEKVEDINTTSSFPDNVFGVKVYTDLIDINPETRPGIKRKIKYIVIHETDNFEVGVGAKNHAKFLKGNNANGTSWHYTVDDTEIYHHIPDNEIAYHAADEIGNKYGIGIELCVNQDGDFQKTFKNASKLVAYLLNEYNLTINDIKTHNDFSGKDCPHLILKGNRMKELKNNVKLIQNGGKL